MSDLDTLCRRCGQPRRNHTVRHFRHPDVKPSGFWCLGSDWQFEPIDPPEPMPAAIKAAMDVEDVRVVAAIQCRADPVNHPKHYNSHPSGVECITVVEHMSFNIGNAVKYLWRADLKGSTIEDLRKSIWYIQREIDRREKTKE